MDEYAPPSRRGYYFSDSRMIVSKNLIRLRRLFIYGTERQFRFLFKSIPDAEGGASFYWTEGMDNIHFIWYKQKSEIFNEIERGCSKFEDDLPSEFEEDIVRREEYDGGHICEVFTNTPNFIHFTIKLQLFNNGVKIFESTLKKNSADEIRVVQKFFVTEADKSRRLSEIRKLVFSYPALDLLGEDRVCDSVLEDN